MRKKERNKLIIGLTIGLMVAFAVGVTAYSGVAPKVIVEGDYIEAVGDSVQGFGSAMFGGTTNLDSLSLADDLTVADNTTLSGTSTIARMDASYTFDMNFQTATSANSGVDDPATEIQLGSVQNTGNDLLCSAVWADISTAVGIFGYEIEVGEASTATSSATLIAQTAVATSSTDVLSKQDDEGSNTNEYFIWEGGNYITATLTFAKVNATSSASFTSAGGNAGDGIAHINCRNRY